MITNTHPQDYESRKVIVDECVKVCPHDGGRFAVRPRDGSLCCLICHGSDFIMRYESDVWRYRQTLRLYRVTL